MLNIAHVLFHYANPPCIYFNNLVFKIMFPPHVNSTQSITGSYFPPAPEKRDTSQIP